MLGIVPQFSSLARKVSHVYIDNVVFRLHHMFTVIVLLVFCVIVTTKQFVGDPIHCIRGQEIPQEIINTYCWIHTTYTIPSANDKTVGKDIPFPGIDGTLDEKKFRYHNYYQWVFFVLFLQSITFYIPMWIWRTWEGGKLEALTKDFSVSMIDEEEKTAKVKQLVNYLLDSWGENNWYAAKYFACELLALLNVLGQWFTLNALFNGHFLKFGVDVIRYSNTPAEFRVDPMINLFPRVTKCRFQRFGPSAGLETYDALCVMPLNVVNEKIFVFLWFWFLILAVLTGLSIVMHALVLFIPPLRYHVLRQTGRHIRGNCFRPLVRNGSFGDFYLIYMIGINVDHIAFQDFVLELRRKLESGSEDLEESVVKVDEPPSSPEEKEPPMEEEEPSREENKSCFFFVRKRCENLRRCIPITCFGFRNKRS